MPWQNNQGGPGGRNPWGQGGRGGGQGPDFDQWLKKSQQKLKGSLPGGGMQGLLVALAGVLLVWSLFTSIYRVDSGEQGLVLRFGEYVRTEPPGLHFKLPTPIEAVIIPNVTRDNRIDVGYRRARGGQSTDVPTESLMLTGDENIVDVNFAVFWRIQDAGKYLFNLQAPQDATVKDVAESVTREVIGQRPIQDALTDRRDEIETAARTLMQETLDSYGAGILIKTVRLEKVDPPMAVIDAFRDVQKAAADRERVVNEAEAYRNDVVPRARGQAAQIVKAAEAYKQEAINRAQGEAARFLSVYQEYAQAKSVTRERMYIETMQQVMAGMTKVIIDDKAGQGVVPYLPLPEIQKPRTGKEEQRP